MLIMATTLLIVGIVSFWDLKTKRIPNILTLPAIVFAIIINFYYSGMNGLEDSFFGLVSGILLLIIPFALGGIGAGDVKLLAVIGALNGLNFVFHTFLYSAIIGGIMALVIAVIRGHLTSVFLDVALAVPNLARITKGVNRRTAVSSGIKFPYGIAFFIGTALAYYVRW